MSTDRERAASELATAHYSIEPGIRCIRRLLSREENGASEPIKLLEVNENTLPMGIRPVFFGADAAKGILFPSVIVEVTPDEYDEIRRAPAKLPNGWELGEELPRTAQVVRQ